MQKINFYFLQIKNQYFKRNSTLQCVFNTPIFNEFFFSDEFLKDLKQKIKEQQKHMHNYQKMFVKQAIHSRNQHINQNKQLKGYRNNLKDMINKMHKNYQEHQWMVYMKIQIEQKLNLHIKNQKQIQKNKQYNKQVIVGINIIKEGMTVLQQISFKVNFQAKQYVQNVKIKVQLLIILWIYLQVLLEVQNNQENVIYIDLLISLQNKNNFQIIIIAQNVKHIRNLVDSFIFRNYLKYLLFIQKDSIMENIEMIKLPILSNFLFSILIYHNLQIKIIVCLILLLLDANFYFIFKKMINLFKIANMIYMVLLIIVELYQEDIILRMINFFNNLYLLFFQIVNLQILMMDNGIFLMIIQLLFQINHKLKSMKTIVVVVLIYYFIVNRIFLKVTKIDYNQVSYEKLNYLQTNVFNIYLFNQFHILKKQILKIYKQKIKIKNYKMQQNYYNLKIQQNIFLKFKFLIFKYKKAYIFIFIQYLIYIYKNKQNYKEKQIKISFIFNNYQLQKMYKYFFFIIIIQMNVQIWQ
ncbi:hypothetical protein IMG5_013420 [Ichthyophthirius multifiliis]|uniref:Transmembrane protein n=1 Tax=Ichthyophthirius multifiliis TaxID=5932 RepID=G0QK60_ICHMU|nr:hypothetical protein IMG5_013420 [Ichthyophthirius multifiliis]EGR34391.1 hypothetical protein IMG5_013420 [Ichthyophthirius multifiliis]|eukprot:XP_004039695.1 hypothetical protein IMG5_013420 [Ichthyophthirius multifiliis]